jgi:hypothetical protein
MYMPALDLPLVAKLAGSINLLHLYRVNRLNQIVSAEFAAARDRVVTRAFVVKG